MKQVLLAALRDAGKILLDNFGRITSYEEKENQSSIVTKADVESERMIMQIISGAFPGHNLLGEETGFQNKKSEYTWVVDPIDGTSNFAAGIPWFGVIICLLKNYKPQMAGCYLPVQEKIYFAEKGKGTTLNGRPVWVSEENKLRNILMSYSLDYSEDPEKTTKAMQFMQHLVQRVRNIRSTNCLIDFCYTADGKLGACANQTTKVWDIAGPVLLIEEAGGVATTLQNQPFDFSVAEENYDRNFEIVASNKILHAKLTALFQKLTKG